MDVYIYMVFKMQNFHEFLVARLLASWMYICAFGDSRV